MYIDILLVIICSYLCPILANVEFLGEKKIIEQHDSLKNLPKEKPKLSEAEEQYKNIALMYVKLLRKKRASHLEAVGVINKLDIQKQTKTIEMLLNKLFSVLHENELKLMSNAYVPGNTFPDEEHLLEAFSMAIENTFFLGEICLRFPDASHKIIDSNREFLRLAQWGIGFSNETKIFDSSTDGAILSLMAQELNLIEKLPNFSNPFSIKNKGGGHMNEYAKIQMSQKGKQIIKRKKKVKGPRLSNNRNEL